MKQSITLPAAPGRIKTFKPVGEGSKYQIEVSVDVTAKKYDDAVGGLFAGYVHVVAESSMAKSSATKLAATKKPANVNLTIDSGGEPAEVVLRKIDASVKAPKLTVVKDGKAAELVLIFIVDVSDDELLRLHTYRRADVSIQCEPTQLDIEDAADKPHKRGSRRAKKSDAAPTGGVQLSIVRESVSKAAEKEDRDNALAMEMGGKPADDGDDPDEALGAKLDGDSIH